MKRRGPGTKGVWRLCHRECCYNSQGGLELNVNKMRDAFTANYTTTVPLSLTLMAALTITGTPTADASIQIHTLITLALAGVRKSSALTG